MKRKRKCILCPSHEYEYCSNCKPDNAVETWRFLFDSENCRDVYKTLESFAYKKISANEAKEQLEKLNVPEKKLMQAPFRQHLDDVYSQATPVAKVEEVLDPYEAIPTREEIPVADEEIAVEEYVEEVPKTRRRRGFRYTED